VSDGNTLLIRHDKLLPQRKILLPCRILHAHRDGDACRLDRARPEDWKLLKYHFQFRIVFE